MTQKNTNKKSESNKGELTVLPKTKRQPQKKQEVSIISPEEMIMKAMDKGMTIDMLNKFLDLKERIQKDEAEKAFREAMSSFQASCPIIVKSNNVSYTGVNYNYASLDKIVEAVKDILGENNLSYTFTTQQTENSVTADCHVFHTAGHSELTSFTIPIDMASKMNAAQKVASALTYAKRYAFCNAFGILTGDVDDDATNLNDKPDDKEKKQEADKKAQEAKEQLKRFLDNNEYVKQAFEILRYTDRAQWAFCHGHEWKPDLVKNHLNQLVDKQNAK